MSENQKLIAEMERRRHTGAYRFLTSENIDTILAALRASDQLPKLLDAIKPVTEELDEETVGYNLTDGSWNDHADFEIQLTVKEINALRSALSAVASPSSSAGEGGK